MEIELLGQKVEGESEFTASRGGYQILLSPGVGTLFYGTSPCMTVRSDDIHEMARQLEAKARELWSEEQDWFGGRTPSKSPEFPNPDDVVVKNHNGLEVTCTRDPNPNRIARTMVDDMSKVIRVRGKPAAAPVNPQLLPERSEEIFAKTAPQCQHDLKLFEDDMIRRLDTSQIDKLATFLLAHDLMPKGFEGGAIDCAIELLKAFYLHPPAASNPSTIAPSDRVSRQELRRSLPADEPA